MRPIIKEVHEELLSGRLLDSAYYGVVFAHKDDHDDIFKLINITLNGKFKVRNNKIDKFIAKSGAVLEVRDEGDGTNKWLHNYGGTHITTVIISSDMLFDNKHLGNRIPDTQHFIMYMCTRLRKIGNCHTRMVVC
jgi:hypothetical protein